MTSKLTLSLFAAIMMFQAAVPPTSGANENKPGVFVWYVQRTATHSGIARRQLQTAGPYYSYADALAKKRHLDQNRSYGTFSYSIARIIRVKSPVFNSQQPVQPKKQPSQFANARRR